MRWSHWVGAALLSTCVGQPQAPGDSEAPIVQRCTSAMKHKLPTAAALCEQAWQETGSEAAAFAGAWIALWFHDDAGVERWRQRALPTVTGARILRVVSDMQRRNGDFAGAEASLREALKLQIDLDPTRAAATAGSLLELTQSNDSVKESLGFARIAWQQAVKSRYELGQAFAAKGLVEVLVDLGELSTADAVVEWL
ncbi:MAG TPA: hypothetical protein VIX73_38960, partial [Kofleriaceae bacterium]